jgi:hypothetical protein
MDRPDGLLDVVTGPTTLPQMQSKRWFSFFFLLLSNPSAAATSRSVTMMLTVSPKEIERLAPWLGV